MTTLQVPAVEPPTIPAQITCRKCETALGACTSTSLVLVGTMVQITSKAILKCPKCKWRQPWRPAR
jgi:Zn finger protein HypA/HybF involved in hydrogenase expression